MLNQAQLIGNVGNEPEIRSTQAGKKVAGFTLATSESYKDKNGEKQTLTEWHRLTAWSPLAEIVEKYVKKGARLFVEGKLKTRSYEDNNGVKRYVTEIEVRNLKMLGGGKDSSSQAQNYEPQATPETYSDGTDDLPF